MDSPPVHKHKSTHNHHSTKSKLSNHDHRLRSDRKDNFPNGYLEDWSSTSSKSYKHKRSSSVAHNKDLPYTSLNGNESTISIEISAASEVKSSKYTPVSIILSTQSNTLLNKDTPHSIRFSTGIIEGAGISIDNNGNEITFQDEGSYRFEMCGDGAPFSDVDVKLIFHSDSFSEEVRPFSEIMVPKDEGKLQLRGLATILPIQKNQKISPRLIAIPDESIVLMGNTRLLIHRVA
jgi:hypothetical protein